MSNIIPCTMHIQCISLKPDNIIWSVYSLVMPIICHNNFVVSEINLPSHNKYFFFKF